MSEATAQLAEMGSQQLPIGEAKKLTEHAKEKPKERLVVFSQVDNKVIEVNPKINFPFKIDEGESTPLGIFAKKPFAKKLKPEEMALEFLPYHLRAALLGRVIFRDNNGKLYRDVDIKGGGFLGEGHRIPSHKGVVSQPAGFKDPRFGYSVSGLLDKKSALLDYKNGEDLNKLGVRVARTIAIIELNEIIVNGEKISIGEAKRRGIIKGNFTPVLQIRAFGTRARISDLLTDDDLEKFSKLPGFKTYEQTSRYLLEDAKKIVAQELGKKSMTDEEYLSWFTSTLGKNIALIHRQGWIHGSIDAQNITLDGRILDFDTLHSVPPDGYEQQPQGVEMDWIKTDLSTLIEAVTRLKSSDSPLSKKLQSQLYWAYKLAMNAR